MWLKMDTIELYKTEHVMKKVDKESLFPSQNTKTKSGTN